MSRADAARSLLSIGDVLSDLRRDFPDTTISKIRFLESIGLVEPVRTSANYRKFSRNDVERLRFILGAQRDRYLPLKVIRAELEAMDRDAAGPVTNGARSSERATAGPRLVGGIDAAPSPESFARDRSRTRLTRVELAEQSGLTDDTLTALESYALVMPRSGTTHYDAEALAVATAVAALSRYGLEPRHLRGFRTAADRELGLIEQLITPLDRQRNPDSRARATEVARELAAACLRLHAALITAGMRR